MKIHIDNDNYLPKGKPYSIHSILQGRKIIVYNGTVAIKVFKRKDFLKLYLPEQFSYLAYLISH